jgi:hypothetical protein
MTQSGISLSLAIRSGLKALAVEGKQSSGLEAGVQQGVLGLSAPVLHCAGWKIGCGRLGRYGVTAARASDCLNAARTEGVTAPQPER